MFRNNQKHLILFVIIFFVGMLLFIQDSYAAPTVTIIVNPPGIAKVRAGSNPIGLAAQVGGSNLTFLWELDGPGKLEGELEGSSVFYRPPDGMDGESAIAVITVTVIDDKGERTPASRIFTIIPPDIPPSPTPAPTPTPTSQQGMSKSTKVAIGVGATAILGGGIYLLLKDGDDNGCNDRDDLTYQNDWEHIYPPEYFGKVWIKIVRRCKNRDVIHHYSINWGPWVYTADILPGEWNSVTLWHTKDDDDSTPLSFHIEPECNVTFGIGEPVGDLIIDIRDGWQET